MTHASDTESPTGHVPLGGIPPADGTMPADAPHEVAIVEVRFSAATAGVSAAVASAVRDALAEGTGKDFPTIQPAVQQQAQTGWQLVSADEGTRVSLTPGVLIIQIGDYAQWSSMRSPLSIVLATWKRLVRTLLVHRIGLRHIDRFEDEACATASSWQGKFDDTLLGPVRNKVFGDKVRGALQLVQIRLDHHHGALLRHGPVYQESKGTFQYVLDIDVFNHWAFEFDTERVLHVAERLNRMALALFQAAVSEDYLRQRPVGSG